MTLDTLVIVVVVAWVLVVGRPRRVYHRPRRRRRGGVLVAAIRMVRRPNSTRSAAYAEHINSPAWRVVRRRALVRAGYRCEHRGVLGRCRARRGLQCHHLSYRDFTHEWDGVRTYGETLRILCRAHHAQADRRRRRYGG